MRVDVDLVVHAKIGKFILIQLSFLLLLNFILDTIAEGVIEEAEGVIEEAVKRQP